MSKLEQSKKDVSQSQARASHDTVNPPNLVSFMLKSWKPASGKMPTPIRNFAHFQRRREALSKLFPGELLLIPTGHQKIRANDTYYSFRAGSDFFYLTGNLEPDCVLALLPRSNGSHTAVLFVEPNPGKTDATFFTDRVKGELWEGARLGVPESRARYGIEDTRSLLELESFVRAQSAVASWGVRMVRGFSAQVEGWMSQVSSPERDQALATALSEMRLVKDKHEVGEISVVIDATRRGFDDVIARMKVAKNERELEGVFFTRARMEGNDVGYGSIVASGAHACTLHWKKNDGALRKGDLLLLDAGIEGNSLYTADITRTLPVSGRFTKEQALVYELVLWAQKAAMKEVKPGNDFMAPNRAAMQVLAHGLEAMGILPTSANEALKDENQFYKRYSLHNVSHMLGLDVHDCAQARIEAYKYGTLVPGMVLTVEPGLYFQRDDLTVPAKFRGIGIRIEDNVVVTDRGCKNLSLKIPRELKDVEAWMQSIWKKKN